MKKIILVLAAALVAPHAAAEFVVSDPVAAGVTHCGRYEAGVFKADVPIVAGACRFDIGAQPVGTTVYTATAVVIDPLWGREESVQSLPLSVARPALPARPVGLRAVTS